MDVYTDYQFNYNNCHLYKLIDRATDKEINLENNRIGNYSITPQHGKDFFIYHIYKMVKGHKVHLFEVKIYPTEKEVLTQEQSKISRRERTILSVFFFRNYKDFKVYYGMTAETV